MSPELDVYTGLFGEDVQILRTLAVNLTQGITESKENRDTIFFYGHSSGPFAFMSNFYAYNFLAPDPSLWLNASANQKEPIYGDDVALLTFLHSEQYMMYSKAILFSDMECAQQILGATSPAACKSLGREVKNFDENVWEDHREIIMEEALLWKFRGGARLQKDLQDELSAIGVKLLQTGERELVEAAPRDRIWGIGFTADVAEKNRAQWGLNLLGKALMRVREKLREQDST